MWAIHCRSLLPEQNKGDAKSNPLIEILACLLRTIAAPTQRSSLLLMATGSGFECWYFRRYAGVNMKSGLQLYKWKGDERLMLRNIQACMGCGDHGINDWALLYTYESVSPQQQDAYWGGVSGYWWAAMRRDRRRLLKTPGNRQALGDTDARSCANGVNERT